MRSVTLSCGSSFPFILALGLHFLSFWPCGPSFPFILAFWAFISFHFGLVGLHFLSFWPFGPSFPFLLAFWAFISFHFGRLGFHFFSFRLFGLSFPCILVFWWSASGAPPPPQVAKNGPFSQCPIQRIYQRQARLHFPICGLLGLHFLSFSRFWPFGPSFPFILGLWAFISLHFGMLSFSCILVWAFIFLHFCFLRLYFLVYFFSVLAHVLGSMSFCVAVG